MTEFIIFDMDGLMFDTEIVGRQAMREVLSSYGYTLTDEFYLELVGTSGKIAKERIMNHYGPNYPYNEITRKTNQLLLDLIEKNGLVIKPGLKELLTYLKKEGIACCVASSSSRRLVMHYLEQSGLQDYFKFIVGGDEVTKTKPDPAIFLKALTKANVKSSQALVLEDSQNGILASTNANIPVICIPDLKQPEEKIAKLCEHVFTTLHDVINYLEANKKVHG